MSTTTSNASDVMRRALLHIDDAVILGALDQVNFKSSTKVSAVVGMPLRSLQQKRDVASFAASAPIAAVRAVLELVALGPLEKVVDELGEHAESPNFEQLQNAVDHVLESGTSKDEVVAVLAFAVGEEFPAAAQCRRLLEERSDFVLPALPEVTSNSSLLAPKEVDEQVREQRRRRREEEKQKKKLPAAPHAGRTAKAKRAEKATRTFVSAPNAPLVVHEIVRRRYLFSPSELENFDPAHAIVGSVVLADVPFDAVDPLVPEQRSKVRPVLVVAASATSLLVRGIYSNQSPSRVLFQPWRRLGLAHVSFIATDRVSVSVAPDDAERIGRLNDDEWNSLF
jgi:hypothetical protein